jgi:hypothetical protein
VKEGECGRGTLYTCMKTEHEICWNSSKEGGGMRENDGGGESKIYCKHYVNVILYPPVQLLHVNLN